MKKYCLGVRNNSRHAYQLMCQSNMKWWIKFVSIILKPLFNDIDIAETKDVIIKERQAPFCDTYRYQSEATTTHYYIWRGWWQQVGELIYDTWHGVKFTSCITLNDEEIEDFDCISQY